MSNKGSYEYPAWCQMETALDSYAQDRAEYLEREARNLGPNGFQQLNCLKHGADVLLRGVQSLVATDGIACLTELAGADAFQQGKPFELLEEHVCITFGWEAMGMLASARERFLNLLQLLKNRHPCNEAKAFLQRVARCYLFGFDAECVVMCRAVLDREFKDKVPSNDVEKWWKYYKSTEEGRKDKRKSAQHNLRSRINTAQFKQQLDDNEGKAAHNVRCQGNKAVHEKPYSGEAPEVVRQTIQVLDALGSTGCDRHHS